MPNLNDLLAAPADSFKRPVALPEGTYYGIIQDFGSGISEKKKTPFIEFSVRLTHAHEDVDLSDYLGTEGAKPINERQMKHTFWMTDNSTFRLTEFIKSLGLDTANRTLGELITNCANQPVVLSVLQKPTKDGEGYFNEVDRMTGVSAPAEPTEGRRRRA